MSFNKTFLTLAIAVTTGWVAAPAFSQTAPVPVASPTSPALKLSSQYLTLAGSQINSDKLVAGLRDGTPVTLVGLSSAGNPAPPPATFTPATGKLGYGNINNALSLAQADLAKVGISNPTPAQLAAALNGGAITTSTGSVTLSGVLAQRASGLGWGEIAKSMGVKLGSIVSASKTDKTESKSNQAAKSTDTHAGNSNANKGGNSGHDNSGSGGGNSGGNGGGNGGGKK